MVKEKQTNNVLLCESTNLKKQIMKSLLTILLIFSLFMGNLSLNGQSDNGFGTRQTQGIIKGILLGGALGGAIGNQKKKSVEGILIGSTLGAMIGSETGKSQDYRRQKEKEAKVLNQYRTQQQFQRNWEIQHIKKTATCSQNHTINRLHHPYNDREIEAARQRAEKAELELLKFEEQRQRQLEKERLIVEYQARERVAMRRLFGLHN